VPYRHGGLRDIASLVTGAAGAWASGALDAASLRQTLRQAAKERCRRRRGDLRSRRQSQHALCRDQDERVPINDQNYCCNNYSKIKAGIIVEPINKTARVSLSRTGAIGKSRQRTRSKSCENSQDYLFSRAHANCADISDIALFKWIASIEYDNRVWVWGRQK